MDEISVSGKRHIVRRVVHLFRRNRLCPAGRVGLVFDITKILSESHILIVHSSSRNLRNGNAIFEASVQVAGTDQLQAIIDKLRKIRGVISVERAKK